MKNEILVDALVITHADESRTVLGTWVGNQRHWAKKKLEYFEEHNRVSLNGGRKVYRGQDGDVAEVVHFGEI